MKVKVLKKFIDKHDGTVHNVGDELTVTKARYNEICAAGDLVGAIVAKKGDSAESEGE